ncbi:MAG: PqqD family protein [Bacteroidia bacterium]|nr:PqqD family protein [Bacteroidia bacterium]HRG02846.1 PqqD family protein [Paludibacteraceae bacterium]
MNIENLYKLKSRFVARKVGNEVVVVPLVNNVAQMERLYTLNETAGFLWENLNETATVESLKTALLENFDVEDSVAERDIQNFLENLKKLV